MTNPKQKSEVSKAFEKTLNSHGFGFQHAIVVKADQLASESKSPWKKPVQEFPVDVQGYGTRIDFILQHKERPLYLLAECKRVNPALANWCFTKAGYIPQELSIAETFFYEKLFIRQPASSFRTSVQKHKRFEDIYHVAVEAKTGDKGDISGLGRGAIEDAATQICRGMNGLIDFFTSHRDMLAGNNQTVGFIPVIFTTAHLWASQVNLGSADLENGTIELSESQVDEKSWLIYHYNQSPGLKHSTPFNEPVTELQQALYHEYVRPIFVVNSTGIESFLCSPMWMD